MPSQIECTELWFLDHAPILGGAERFALKLAAAAAKRKPALRCVMVCPRDSELAIRSRAAGVEVREARFPPVAPPSPRSPGAIIALRRLLSDAPASAVIVANSARAQAYTAAAALLSARSRPIVNLAHEQETAARGVARATLRRGGALVTIGANAAATYERALPGITVHRINNVLDERELAGATARVRPAAAAAIGRRADDETLHGARSAGHTARPRLAVLARMIPEKGILELIDEAGANRERWSKLDIGAPAQDRAYEARVRARVLELGLEERVELHGEVRDVPRFLDATDALVVPSIGGEGQPTAIIEALAHGLPVLVREPILSEDFEGLPVGAYRDAQDFGSALARLQTAPASAAKMRTRFGTEQALDGLLLAAC